MDIFEIAKWEFVMPPTFVSVFVVYCQEPLAVLGEAVLFDEFFFDLCGRMVVTPRVPFVIGKLTLFDESLGVFIAGAIELYGHAGCPPIVSRPENRPRLVHAAQLTLWNERRQLC